MWIDAEFPSEFTPDPAVSPLFFVRGIASMLMAIKLARWPAIAPATCQPVHLLLEKTQYGLWHGVGLGQHSHTSLLQNLRLGQVGSFGRKIGVHDPAA